MKRVVLSLAVAAALTVATWARTPSSNDIVTNTRLAFWNTQRRGGNFFNEAETRDRFRAARAAGLEWVRLVPDKWPSKRRDFLIGDADDFRGLDHADLAHLEKVLGWADSEGVAVVVGMLSLPGCRWVQQNGGERDYRLWHDERYQLQAVAFWRELAANLRDHPAVVAYNPLNEPHPAREEGHDGVDAIGFADWLEEHRGTTADLDRFYARIVSAIREVDPNTPVMVEGYGHGSVGGLAHLTPIDDPAVLYSFHFYEPWEYTNRKANRNRYAYPDRMPTRNGRPGEWRRNALGDRLQPLAVWADQRGIAENRIVAAEFGCDRGARGAHHYLEDVIASLNDRRWHWAFYAFREDTWDRMDYELGAGGLGAAYWEAVEQGERPERPRKDNALWRAIRTGLKAGR